MATVMPVVAIVGRPNVGKSTLFNRWLGTRAALVMDRPGVTRDRHYAEAEIGRVPVRLVDTGGLEAETEDDLFRQIRSQVRMAIDEATVVVFVVDRQTGPTAGDSLAADLLRRAIRPDQTVILVANKCDDYGHEPEAEEFWDLGWRPWPVSAAHGRGLGDVDEAIVAALRDAHPGLAEPVFTEPSPDGEGEEAEQLDGAATEIKVAVIGRPNIGKSTLLNRLLGEERHVVHDAPGTTMDAVDSVLEVDGQAFRLIDTAGVRRRARIDDRLENWAASMALRTVERCHVTLLMVDGVEGPTDQDARLAQILEDRGRATIVLVNRWDRVKDMAERSSDVLEDELRTSLPHLRWAPVLFISALTGKGCARILPLIREVYGRFDQRIPTAKLNAFLEGAVASYQPPQKHHHPVKLNYMTQVRVRPPSFVVWCNSPDGIKAPYKRYIENELRERFDLVGTPVRLDYRKKRKPGET